MKKANQKIIPSLGQLVKVPLLVLFFLGLFVADTSAQTYVGPDAAFKILKHEQADYTANSSSLAVSRDIEEMLASDPIPTTTWLFVETMFKKLNDLKNVSTALDATEQDLLDRGIDSQYVTAVKQDISAKLQK